MNIFVILFLTIAAIFVIGLVGFAIYDCVYYDSTKENIVIVCSFILIVVTMVLIPMSTIKFQTNEELAYISNYLSQKETIEESLENELITGYERAALVSKSAELNGELAERKMQFNRWYNIYADNTIYDDVTPISFNGREA
jgi:hypothetical protein